MRIRWLLPLLIAAVIWLFAGGVAARSVRSLQILDELRRPGPRSWLRRATAAPSRSAFVLAAGSRRFAVDLYRPATGGGDVPVIFVPGMVEEGKDDPRVAPFAELLARSGFTVLVPDLRSFRTLRVHPDNLAELSAVLDAVAARADLAPRGRVGLFGVSYAGGIAVLAALDPARAPRVAFVATAGAYADLDTTLRFLATGRTVLGGREHLVTPEPYGRLVFLRTYEEFLTVPRDRDLLQAMVARRMRDPAAALDDLASGLTAEGRLIYDLFEVAGPADVPGLIERLPWGLSDRMTRLSPARQPFGALTARLYLVHDRRDGTFPASETIRLAELACSRVPVRVVLLDALRHVEPQPWARGGWGRRARDLAEAARLAGWWYALLGEQRRREPVAARR